MVQGGQVGDGKKKSRDLTEVVGKDGGNLTDGDLAAGGAKQPQQGGFERRAFQGLEVVIDRPKGFVQRGTSPDGEAWERTYKNDYGFIAGTAGGDGEALDVFLGDEPADKDAHWAVQRKADGSFDEYKIVLGAGSAENAEAIYLDHIPAKFLASWTMTSVEMLKAILGLHPAEVMKALLLEQVAKRIHADELEASSAIKIGLVEQVRPELAVHVVEKADDGAEAPPEMRYILGPVLVPETPDAQGDIYSADVIEATAHLWASDFRNMGLQHKALVNDRVRMVESYIARADHVIEGATIKAGTWMLGAIVDDEDLWGRVKSGAITGWSIGGFASKEPVE